MTDILRAMRIVVASLLVSGLVGAANAGPYQTYPLSARTDYLWMATDNATLGENWIRGLDGNNPAAVDAQHPYGNSATTALAAEDMMWYCPPGGCASNTRTGLAYFSTVFNLNSDFRVAGGQLKIIADDYFELYLNGTLITFGLLDMHMDGSGQPVPIVLDLSLYKDDFYGGENLIAIKAMDGYQMSPGGVCSGTTMQTQVGDFCQSARGFEYVYVSGAIDTIPEPPVGSLMVFSMAALAAMRRFGRS